MAVVKILCLLIAFSLTASALPVDVSVPEIIRGVSHYTNYSESVYSAPQRFMIEWENQGSVSCRVRIRIDFSSTNASFTGWSLEKPIEPGDHSTFEVYFYPNISGKYTARVYSYHCNIIEELKNVSFVAYVPEKLVGMQGHASNITGTTTTLMNQTPAFTVRTSNTKNRVEFRIKAKENLSDVVIVPVKYPLGWIAESANAGDVNAGNEKVVDAAYEPSVWKPVELVYEVSTMDGRYHETVSVFLAEEKKEYDFEQLAIVLLSTAVLFLLTLLIRERRKRR